MLAATPIPASPSPLPFVRVRKSAIRTTMCIAYKEALPMDNPSAAAKVAARLRSAVPELADQPQGRTRASA